MLELRNVMKTFARKATAVDGVSLVLERGVVGLIGHNGAGKTTLMQMIATLTRPSSGEIEFDGVDIVRQPDAIRSASAICSNWSTCMNRPAVPPPPFRAACGAVSALRRRC